jgi:multicomponent K+:H+ antiporter subunit G
VLIASMLFFSVLQTRPVIHELLISVFVTLTTPVTLMLLVRASLLRDRAEGTLHDPAIQAATEAPDTRQKKAGNSAEAG